MKRGRPNAFLFFVACMALAAAVFPQRAAAGVLDWTSPGGLSSSLDPLASHSSGAADWYNPALLPDAPGGVLEISGRHDDIYHLRKGDTTQYAISNSARSISFYGPINPRIERERAVIGFERTSEQLRILSDAKINGTSLNLQGHGLTLAAGKRLGRIRLGYSNVSSEAGGAGTSDYIEQSVTILDSSTTIAFRARHSRLISQIAYDTGRFGTFAYSRTAVNIPAHLEIWDSNDYLSLNLNMRGHGSEARWSGRLSNTHSAAAFYREGTAEALDPLEYSGRANFGINHTVAGNHGFGLEVSRRLSRATSVSAGFEKYCGRLQGAGTFDLIASFFGFIGGYYLYHPVADVSFSDWKLAFSRNRGRTAFFGEYHYRPMDVSLHFDGAQRFFFGFVSQNETLQDYESDNLVVHTLRLGMSRKVSKYGSVNAVFTQSVPTGGRRETEPAPAAGGVGPAQPEVYKKVSGGSSFSLGYRLEF